MTQPMPPDDPARAPDTPSPAFFPRLLAWLVQDREWWQGVALYLLALGVYTVVNNGRVAHLNYFLPLADAFLHGHLDVAEHPSWLSELIPYQGRYYVVYPPMPAVLLMPFVLFWGPALDQADVSIVIGALDAALFSAVLHALGYRGWQRFLYASLFAFGTILWFSVQYGNAWHFAHVCALFFLLLFMRDVLLDRHPLRAGLLLGCAAMSRLPTGMAFPFAIVCYAHRALRPPVADAPVGPGLRDVAARLDWSRLGRYVAFFLAGAAIMLALYGVYNYLRFGNPLQMGYTLIPGVTHEAQYRFGILHINNVGKNLYAMLLKAPNAVDTFPWIQPWHLGGPNILFITPVFLWALKARNLDWFNLGAWATILLTLVPILTHGGQGEYQFSYRFSLDFTPFLLLLAIRGLGPRPSPEGRLAIALAFLVNFWGMWATCINWWTTVRVC